MKPGQRISPDTLLIMLLTLIFPIVHHARSSSDDASNDQMFGLSGAEIWSNAPLIGGTIALLGGITYLWVKRRK